MHQVPSVERFIVDNLDTYNDSLREAVSKLQRLECLYGIHGLRIVGMPRNFDATKGTLSLDVLANKNSYPDFFRYLLENGVVEARQIQEKGVIKKGRVDEHKKVIIALQYTDAQILLLAYNPLYLPLDRLFGLTFPELMRKFDVTTKGLGVAISLNDKNYLESLLVNGGRSRFRGGSWDYFRTPSIVVGDPRTSIVVKTSIGVDTYETNAPFSEFLRIKFDCIPETFFIYTGRMPGRILAAYQNRKYIPPGKLIERNLGEIETGNFPQLQRSVNAYNQMANKH